MGVNEVISVSEAPGGLKGTLEGVFEEELTATEGKEGSTVAAGEVGRDSELLGAG